MERTAAVFVLLAMAFAGCAGDGTAPTLDDVTPSAAPATTDVSAIPTEAVLDPEAWCEEAWELSGDATDAVERLARDIDGSTVTAADFKVPRDGLIELAADAESGVRPPLNGMIEVLGEVMGIFESGDNTSLRVNHYAVAAGEVAQYCHRVSPNPAADEDAELACRGHEAMVSDLMADAVGNDREFYGQVRAVHSRARYSDMAGIAENSQAMIAAWENDGADGKFLNASLRLNDACRYGGRLHQPHAGRRMGGVRGHAAPRPEAGTRAVAQVERPQVHPSYAGR